MRIALLLCACIGALAAATPAQAQDMNAQTFYERGKALESKGPLALFDGDMKVLKREGEAAAQRAIARNEARRAEGRAPLFCLDGADRMGPREFLRATEAFTASQRKGWTTSDMTARIFARNYPC